MQASKLRNIMTLASMTALPFAFCTGFAEARGVGITHQAAAKETVMAGRGHVAASPALSLALPSQAEGEIVAERTAVQVSAAEAESLIDELRLQLATQPAATFSIRWQLTKPYPVR